MLSVRESMEGDWLPSTNAYKMIDSNYLYYASLEPSQTAEFISTDSLVDFLINMKTYISVQIITISYQPINMLNVLLDCFHTKQSVN